MFWCEKGCRWCSVWTCDKNNCEFERCRKPERCPLVPEKKIDYDVNKIVERLLSESVCTGKGERPLIMLDRAVEIVKAGLTIQSC